MSVATMSEEAAANSTANLDGIRRRMRVFAAESLGGSATRRDAEGAFWREGWDACGREGVIALPIAAAHGGRGAGLAATIAAMESLGETCDDLGLLFAINAHLWACAIPIQEFGSDAQKARWLRPLAEGRIIGGHGATEPNAGSDIFGLETTATVDGDGWILNGVKSFVANGPVADLFVVYATTDRAKGELGVTAFIVERSAAGVHAEEPLDKMGLRTAPSGILRLEDCRVGPDALLGAVGGGAACFNCSMEWERGAILAMHLGRMQRQLDECVRHARTRRQFGVAIGANQSVANRIVDMKVRLDAARPLVERIGALKDAGRNAMLESAVAKLFVSEAAVASGLDAIQIMGSRGYLRDGGVERDLRDALGARIYSGTNELQRVMIARLLGLPSSLPDRRAHGGGPR